MHISPQELERAWTTFDDSVSDRKRRPADQSEKDRRASERRRP